MTKNHLIAHRFRKHGELPYVLLLFFFLIHFFAKAFQEPFPIGARSWALGNASVSLIDPNAFYNNPASMAFLENKVFSVSCHVPFGYSDLKTLSLAGAFSFGNNALGIGMIRFGDKLFNQQKIGIAFAKKNHRISLGGKISLLQESISNERSNSTLITEFGLFTKLSSKLSLGFLSYNLTRASLHPNEIMPTVLRIGVAFFPTKQVLFTLEAENHIKKQTQVKAGLEYQIIKNVYLRTGISTKPLLAHFGFGIQKRQFLFEIAAVSHTTLGISSHFSINYYLNKNINQ